MGEVKKIMEEFKNKKKEDMTAESILEMANKLAPKAKAGHASDKMQTDYSRFDSIDDPDADPLAAAKKNKDLGNNCFKNGLYESAISAYTEALDELPDQDDKEDKDTKDLRIVLYCNRAACNMKIKNHDQCIKDCDLALKSDRKAMKALFRRAKAQESKKLYEKACKDILRLLHFHPGNKSATKLLTKLKKKVHSRSFSGLKSSVLKEEAEHQKKNSKGSKKPSLSEKMSQITGRAPPPSKPSKPEKLSKEDEKDLESVTKKGYCHFRSDKDSASRDIIGDIRPKKIGSGSPAPALPKAQSHTSAVVGSDWNSAGTWEEKDKSKQATARLKELLKGLSWGAAEITKLSKVEGTASFNLSRKGKFFVFEYRLEMEAKVAHSSGSDRTFKLTFPDVSSVVLDDKDDDFEMDVSVKSGKKDAECLSALEALKFHVDQAINTFANEFIAQLK